ncbi:MAG: hypothetical protein WA798_12940, partial [Candidatus Acidiferrum sp.]
RKNRLPERQWAQPGEVFRGFVAAVNRRSVGGRCKCLDDGSCSDTHRVISKIGDAHNIGYEYRPPVPKPVVEHSEAGP